MWWYTWVYEGIWGYMEVYEGICEYMKVYGSIWMYMQAYSHTYLAREESSEAFNSMYVDDYFASKVNQINESGAHRPKK